jgi:hypothetical protein
LAENSLKFLVFSRLLGWHLFSVICGSLSVMNVESLMAELASAEFNENPVRVALRGRAGWRRAAIF